MRAGVEQSRGYLVPRLEPRTPRASSIRISPWTAPWCSSPAVPPALACTWPCVWRRTPPIASKVHEQTGMERREQPLVQGDLGKVSRAFRSSSSPPTSSVCHTPGPEQAGPAVGGGPVPRVPSWLPGDIAAGCAGCRFCGRSPGTCD